MNPALAAVGMAMAYVALAYAVYSYLSAMYNTCKEGEYELACKVNGSLCIYTGEECVANGFFGCRKRVKVYMCYAGQVAKIFNEYGLPQLHAPDCRIENCNAGYDGNQCGCRSAYTVDGHPTNTRHKGFTIDEFQRLDFGRIPIAEMLVQTIHQTLLLPEENYYSADYPGWLEIWAYWIAEEDIRRGKWAAVDGKCVVIDQGQSFLTPPPSPTDMAGNPIYDDNGYDASTGQYFSDDPVCQNWFISEIMSRNLEVDLNEDCTLRPKKSMGEIFFAVNHDLCPIGFTEEIDCYCNCPPIAEDMQNPRMICPRPNKNNLIQRIVGYVNPAAFNAYYGRSDVQIRYAPYVP